MGRLITALILVACVSSQAQALSCNRIDPIASNTIFFEGTVLTKTKLDVPQFQAINQSFRFTIRVDRPFVGVDTGHEFEIRQDFWSDDGYEVGVREFFAVPSEALNKMYHVGMCESLLFEPYEEETNVLSDVFSARLKQLRNKEP